ncbi:MAG TPA: DUF1064 domain-containing protein [Candidatus Angelobacter sp.]|nr:DUF1064 domain-containing protein [Candidatus Angelobacter sp.]
MNQVPPSLLAYEKQMQEFLKEQISQEQQTRTALRNREREQIIRETLHALNQERREVAAELAYRHKEKQSRDRKRERALAVLFWLFVGFYLRGCRMGGLARLRSLDSQMTRIPIHLPDTSQKYHAERTNKDGFDHGFGSRKEANRFQELYLLQRAGAISELEADKRKLRYDLVVNGVLIATYEADFRYRIAANHKGGLGNVVPGQLVVEDSKGARTPAYKLKKLLMLALYGIEIKET